MSPEDRHIPTRTCVICRVKRQRSDLLRIVRSPGGEIVFDRTGRMDGRGAYVCGDADHWESGNPGKCIDRGRLNNALKKEIDDSIVKQLSETILSYLAEQAI